MKRILPLLLLATFLHLAATAQDDTFQTSKGPLKVNPVYHGSLWFSWNNLVVAVDPYGGAERYAAMGKPHLVLITDIHGDHMDSSTLVKMDLSKAVILAPKAVTEKITTYLPKGTDIRSMANGESLEISGLGIKAIPMYNLPDTADPRHPKGRGNGYVITAADKKVYVSGDTEDIPEMRQLQGIDIAFVCMNLPYTMNIDQAAAAVLDFKPKTVYPYHFRGQGGFSDVEAFAKKVKDANGQIDVRLRKWY